MSRRESIETGTEREGGGKLGENGKRNEGAGVLKAQQQSP